MAYRYEVKGVVLGMLDMLRIAEYYEAACTAEFILENYPQITDDDIALSIGHEVREKMADWGLCDGQAETDAIEEVLKERGLWVERRDEDEC